MMPYCRGRRINQLDSNYIFADLASGLEKGMQGTPKGSNLYSSMVAQISAALFYQTKVIEGVMTNKTFTNRFQSMIYSQIEEDFGQYIDAKARSNPASLHHVYEWNKAGSTDSRLFKLNMKGAEGASFKISTELLPSKSLVPTKRGKHRHVFVNKASLIESGKPVVIKPRYSEQLVFEINGETIFMPKGESVTVNRPGGKKATNQFNLATSHFFSGNLVKLSIQKSGFQRMFNSSMKKALRLPQDVKMVKYKFSPNVIRNQADMALRGAFGGTS